MENKIKKFEEYIFESVEDNSENILDFVTNLGIDVTKKEISQEDMENILIEISDLVDDEKYHWVETELKKIVK